MRRVSFNNAASSGAKQSGIFRGIVVSIGSDDLLSVRIPRLGLENIYEGIPYAGPVPAAGDVVFLGFLEGKSGSFVAFTGVVYEGNTGAPTGDITSVIAGTNLNGGGSSGTVTVNLESDITLTSVTADAFYGDLYGAIHILVKNVSGGSLTKGTPVYATGAVGASGAVEVEASLAGTGSTMPAMGLLDQDLDHNGQGDVVVSGVLQNIDTDTPGYSVGDELFVAASGGLTTTRPTGSSELVQKIGKVIRVQQNTGEILVQGAGRTNDVPNGTLANDISGNAATATALETAQNIGGVSFNGTANINLPGVNTAGNQDTSGNAATASLAADSSLLGGLGLSAGNSAPSGSQVIKSHTNGYTYLGWINTVSGSTTSTIDRIYASNDQFVRYVTPATFRSQVTDPHYLLNSTDTFSGKLTITGDMVADDVQATTGVFYGGGSDTSQPNEYMQFSESGNWWRVVNDGGEDFRVTSSGYAQTQGRRYYFGIGSNDYVVFEDTTNTFAFYADGSQVGVVNFNNSGNHLIPATAGYMGADSGSQYPTGSGTDARIITGFGVSTLVKSSSVAAEKENITSDLGAHLTVDMVDAIVPKMWNRIIAPGYPEIGPIAEDMDAISPFLSTAGTDIDGEHLLMGVNSQTWMSLLTLTIQDLRSQVAALTTRLEALEAE